MVTVERWCSGVFNNLLFLHGLQLVIINVFSVHQSQSVCVYLWFLCVSVVLSVLTDGGGGGEAGGRFTADSSMGEDTLPHGAGVCL